MSSDKPQNLFRDFNLMNEAEKQRFLELLFEHDILTSDRLKRAKENIQERRKRNEQQQKERTEKAELEKKEREKPENVYPIIWKQRNTNPTRLQEWLKSQSTEALQKLCLHLEGNTQHLNSIYGFTISDAINTLKTELAQRNKNPKPILNTIKERISYAF